MGRLGLTSEAGSLVQLLLATHAAEQASRQPQDAPQGRWQGGWHGTVLARPPGRAS
jgi:hypothetical protein